MRLQFFDALNINNWEEVLNNEAIGSFSSWVEACQMKTAAICICSQFEDEESGVVAARKDGWMDSISSCTRICTLFHCRSGNLSHYTAHSFSCTDPRRGLEFEDQAVYKARAHRHTCGIGWGRNRCGCCWTFPLSRAYRRRDFHSESQKQRLAHWRWMMFLLWDSSFRSSLSICTTRILGESSCLAAAGLAYFPARCRREPCFDQPHWDGMLVLALAPLRSGLGWSVGGCWWPAAWKLPGELPSSIYLCLYWGFVEH